MTESSTGVRPLAASVPTRPGPQGRDRAERVGASTSSPGCPSGARAAGRSCSSTASCAGSWVWEHHLQYFAARGWEGHALNLRNHFWSQTADPTTLSFDTYTEDVLEAIERLGSSVVVVGHGMGGLLALKAVERHPVGGLILLSSELPRELRPPAHAHELREIPEVYGRDLLGWETLPERLQRDHRDLALADILRIQHLLGQKPHESGAARRQMLAGVPVERARFDAIPTLVIGAGLDRYVPGGVERAPRRVAVGRVRAVRRPLPLRPGPGRDEPRPGGRDDARIPRGESPLGARWYHSGRSGARRHRPTCRIRLEAQDTALSRRRSPVRIRYAVPATRWQGRADRRGRLRDQFAGASPGHPRRGPVRPARRQDGDGRDPLRPGSDRRGDRLDATPAATSANGWATGPASTSRSSPRSPRPWPSARSRGAPTALLIGIAPTGGKLPAAWRRAILDSIAAGLDILSGLHTFIGDDPEFAAAARTAGVEIIDYRRPPSREETAVGRAHGPGKHVILTVGTDCAIGKMSVALELRRAAVEAGLAAVFVPTGQTGMMIDGWGVAVDRVISDFMQRHLRVARRAGRGEGRLDHRRGPGLARSPGLLAR